ncbi:hypothetical protein AltI4_13640 [Alteromonas sp. I4]|nr:hypothetical protein AltI4_13640 [Alteromonas sp. I4]
MELHNNSHTEINIEEVNSLMSTFEAEELEERLEFAEAGWNSGSDCPWGYGVCYIF